jgi:predicted  nucleic acid-binding Zn-ribbon protein
MTQENNQPPEPSFGDRMAIAFVAFVRAFVRLLAIVVLAVLLGAGIFYGLPALYTTYIEPLQTSIIHLQDAQSLQDQTNQQVNQRLDDLQKRLNTLETQNDTVKQQIGELNARLDSQEGASQELASTLEAAQAADEKRFNAASTGMDQLDKKLADLSDELDRTNQDLQDIADEFHATNTPVAALARELQLVKAMEILTRSRISLISNNVGLAREDIQSGRNMLAALLPQVPSDQVESLTAIVARLDLALGNLPDSPVLAADDLEIAWQLLQRGLSYQPSETPISTLETTAIAPAAAGTETGTPAASASATQGTSTTPEPTATPTPTPTATLTPTPTGTP